MTHRLTAALLLAICLAATGCSGDKGKELFETAQFEEKQNNREHATKLYEEIVRKHPDSPLAAKARERLNALTIKQ
jgi:outer membrane protein assembly factor BamD (BamD/ComL family)